MRALLVAACLLPACSFRVSAGQGGDAGDDARRGDAPTDVMGGEGGGGPTLRKKRITIDHTKVSGSQTGFPVWIALTDPDIAARALADGSDIFFTLPNGTPLPYERQRWVAATGRLEAWVRLDLADATATELDVRYGDATAMHAPDAAMVFSSGFRAVWHLESTTTIDDARGMFPGTPVGLAGNAGVAAQLGQGVQFTGGNDEISFTNPLAGDGAHTISLWVNQAATADNDALVVLGNGACGQSRWLHGRYNTATIATGFYCNDWSDPAVDIIGNGWTLLHWVFANGTSRLYSNGAPAAGPFTQSGSTINTMGGGGHLGNAPGVFGGNMGAHAAVDEVRIANATRNAGWIETEFANQSSPSTFYSVGAEQLP